MLPTLTLTATSAPSAPIGKGGVGAEEPAENGGISFAALLSGGAENTGGPAKVDGADILARLQVTGSPATATGKDMPVPAIVSHTQSDPLRQAAPEAHAAAASAAARTAQGPVNRVDSLALSTAITAILAGDAGDAQPSGPALPPANLAMGKAVGAGAEPALKVPQPMVGATPVGSQPGNSETRPTTPAGAVPGAPPALMRSVPKLEASIAHVPRSTAISVSGEAEETSQPLRSALPITSAKQAPETSEQPAPPSFVSSVTAAAAQSPTLSAQPATNAQATPMPATVPQAAEQPRDFSSLIDRLVQARDAAAPSNPQTVRTVLSHAEFGAVTVRFDMSGSNLSASFASQDPAFAPAARAALAADAGQRGDDQQRGGYQAQHQSGGQAGADSSGGHANLYSGSHERGAANSGEAHGGAGNDPQADGEPTDLPTNHAAQANQRGFYI